MAFHIKMKTTRNGVCANGAMEGTIEFRITAVVRVRFHSIHCHHLRCFDYMFFKAINL